jgi:hypothetical protein
METLRSLSRLSHSSSLEDVLWVCRNRRRGRLLLRKVQFYIDRSKSNFIQSKKCQREHWPDHKEECFSVLPPTEESMRHLSRWLSVHHKIIVIYLQLLYQDRSDGCSPYRFGASSSSTTITRPQTLAKVLHVSTSMVKR